MLDPWAIAVLRSPLTAGARWLEKKKIKPDQVTLAGFGLGMLAFFAVWMNAYRTGLVLILLNRIMDGLDGALARQTVKTDAGGFLDICLDFIFYSGVVAGFALARPQHNAVFAVILLLSFMGTGTSFLAFAALAQKHDLKSVIYPHKAMYYMGGLTEGTETLVFFVLVCLFPASFPLFAGVFSFLCLVTTVTRIFSGYTTLKKLEQKQAPPPR